MTRKFRVVYHEFLNRELIKHITSKMRNFMYNRNTRKDSERVALRCSKYFFDHSKVRFTALVVNVKCRPQHRNTA